VALELAVSLAVDVVLMVGLGLGLGLVTNVAPAACRTWYPGYVPVLASEVRDAYTTTSPVATTRVHVVVVTAVVATTTLASAPVPRLNTVSQSATSGVPRRVAGSSVNDPSPLRRKAVIRAAGSGPSVTARPRVLTLALTVVQVDVEGDTAQDAVMALGFTQDTGTSLVTPVNVTTPAPSVMLHASWGTRFEKNKMLLDR
jgi:hypothetical protein